MDSEDIEVKSFFVGYETATQSLTLSRLQLIVPTCSCSVDQSAFNA
jgi:hypothetical protein